MTLESDLPEPNKQPFGEISDDGDALAAGGAEIAPPLIFDEDAKGNFISVTAPNRGSQDPSRVPSPSTVIITIQGNPRSFTPTGQARRSPSALIIRLAALILLGAVIVWAYRGIGFDYQAIRQGFPVAKLYLAQLFPHNASDRAEEAATLRGELGAVLQTLQIAIVGTVSGAALAFPISFFAARTTSLFRPLSVAVKTALNIGRAVPVLIYAVFVVAFFGLGPPPGTIAITIGSFVMLAKLYAEGLEGVAAGPVEAVRATGGNAIQAYVFGMLPQVFPNYLSATLYAFELNIAASAILGLVGAGGLGYDLQNDLRLFKMLDVGTILLLLIVLVNAADYISYRVRQLFT